MKSATPTRKAGWLESMFDLVCMLQLRKRKKKVEEKKDIVGCTAALPYLLHSSISFERWNILLASQHV